MICPCKSNISYDQCCKPFHEFSAYPEIPEQLMRSRYAAYALKIIDYIIETTDSNGPLFQKDKQQWKVSIEQFCQSTSFQDLTILDTSRIDDKQATVTFQASLKSILGVDTSFTEKSLFTKKNNRWFYHSSLEK